MSHHHPRRAWLCCQSNVCQMEETCRLHLTCITFPHYSRWYPQHFAANKPLTPMSITFNHHNANLSLSRHWSNYSCRLEVSWTYYRFTSYANHSDLMVPGGQSVP